MAARRTNSFAGPVLLELLCAPQEVPNRVPGQVALVNRNPVVANEDGLGIHPAQITDATHK